MRIHIAFHQQQFFRARQFDDLPFRLAGVDGYGTVFRTTPLRLPASGLIKVFSTCNEIAAWPRKARPRRHPPPAPRSSVCRRGTLNRDAKSSAAACVREPTAASSASGSSRQAFRANFPAMRLVPKIPQRIFFACHCHSPLSGSSLQPQIIVFHAAHRIARGNGGASARFCLAVINDASNFTSRSVQ